MTVLAIDTCLGAASVALLRRSKDLFEIYEECDTGHAERIVPMLAQIMRDAGADFTEVETIAVTVGPGSFTGVRTGIAMARALALATGRPVVGATSLAVMAAGASESFSATEKPERIMVAVDARRGEFYGQHFIGPTAEPAGPAMIDNVEILARSLPDTPCMLIGSGAPAVIAAAFALGKPVTSGVVSLQPRARTLAAMPYNLSRLDPIVPLYLRAPDAKPQSASILPRA